MNTFQMMWASLGFLLSAACNENMLPDGNRNARNCMDSAVVYKQVIPSGNAKTDLEGNIIRSSTISYRTFIFSGDTSLIIDSVLLAKKKAVDLASSKVSNTPVYGGTNGKQELVASTECAVTEARFSYAGESQLTVAQQDDVLVFYHKGGKSYKIRPSAVIELEQMVTQ